jgi:hyperosmotically inducible periplasmic protein
MLKKNIIFTGLAICILLLGPVVSMASNPERDLSVTEIRQSRTLQNRAYNSLLRLPYYGVFDILGVSVTGNTVTLTGRVTRAALKSEAEWTVRGFEGIDEVVNRIEILPLSPMDDDIRVRAYYAIYLNPGFEKYRTMSSEPIRIIVENGNITLIGVVDTPHDRIIAEMSARRLAFVFSVTNQLKVN